MRWAILALALMSSACGRPTYPPQVQTNFMTSCQNGGSNAARCTCIWKRSEAEVPVTEFMAAERAMAAGEDHPLKQRILGYAAQCPQQAP